MKRILLFAILLVSVVSFAQDYNKEWKIILEKETEGEIKQAASLTDIIYKKAKKDKNEPQAIKAFFFRAKYMQVIEEDAQYKIIKNIQDDIKDAPNASKAILQSLYAQMLVKIYNKNFYRINNKASIDNYDKEDYRQWSAVNFRNEINTVFTESLEQKVLLYSIPLAQFDEIIDFAPEQIATNRPLFDFLAEQYLDYLLNTAYMYEDYYAKNIELLFGSSQKFCSLTIDESLTDDLKKALSLLIDIEKHFSNTIQPQNLQRAFLRRLNYIDKKISNPLKDSIYLKTIRQLSQQAENTVYKYRAKLTEAKLLIRMADKKTAPQNLIDAVAVLDSIITAKSKNDSGSEALGIKKNIITQEAGIKLENYLTPDSPSLASITFKNMDSITVQFYKVPFRTNFTDIESLIKNLTGKQPFISKRYALPNKHDYFTYSTEIILPSLSNGTYALLLSGNKENFTSENIKSVDKIYVSQLSILKQDSNDYNILQALDKTTGKPVKDVTAFPQNAPQQSSNENGRIRLVSSPAKKKKGKYRYNNYETITFIHGKDTLSTDLYINSYYKSSNDEDETCDVYVQLYTDRSIYRPGQTVQFKGIAYQKNRGKYSVLPDVYFSVEIKNPNYKRIKEFRLKTNEYGSFTEKITLPKNTTGRFEIIVDEDNGDDDDNYDDFWEDAYFSGSSIEFNVEEYKRPTFEIIFDKIKEDIRLNETVAIKGTARAFSNAPIADAVVKYIVTRKSKLKEHYGYDSYKDIVKGQTTTDSNGNFEVEFDTKPDEKYEPEDRPVFIYEIETEVIDINGETHTAKYNVYAGYHALEVDTSLPEKINITDKPTVNLETNNLNGEFLPAEGTVEIYKVTAPYRYYRSRPWTKPEIQTIPEKEFSEKFPHIPYEEIKDTTVGKPLFSQVINTKVTTELKLENLSTWQSGKYELIFTAKDSLGNQVSSTKRFTLVNPDDKIPSDKKLFEYNIINSDYSKDGYVEIELSAGIPLFVTILAKSDEIYLYDKDIMLDIGKKKIKIPVLKNPTTSMAFLISYLWQGQLYEHKFDLIVPRKKETLGIETEFTTNKLTPGSEQSWSFTINGSKKPLEILASMYDASLDKLTINDYNHNYWDYLNTNNYRNGGWLSRESITRGTTGTRFASVIKPVKLPKSYDSFYFYGFDFDNAAASYYIYQPKNQIRSKNDILITGTVTDSIGMPIPGANITIEGTTEGTQTDFDGKYSIYVSSGEKIVVNFVGMVSQTLALTSNIIDIRLEEDAQMLQDVVVEAYRTTTKSQSNVAVITVTSKTIEGRPNASFVQTLQGQVPGIEILIAKIPGAQPGVVLRGAASIDGQANPLYIIDGIPLSETDSRNFFEDEIADMIILKEDKSALYGPRALNGVVIITTKKGIEALQQVKARKNFDETAFFYPQLKTDRKGKLSFSFTTPEALTEWKLRLLAHNKNAASGYYEKLFYTQKDLMIVPNMPRFFRERDTITLIAKVTNLTTEVKTGSAMLQLFDAVTMKPVDAEMLNVMNVKPFNLSSKGNTTVSWTITVPKGIQGVQYKVLAKAGDFTDGEENILPVLTNSIMVTESIPLWVKPNSSKQYSFTGFDESLTNKDISQIGLTLEYTSNPTWLALQSLPYLMEFEHECSEQVFSRYYANSIATFVLNSNPKIAEVFESWRKSEKPISKFDQNEKLKSIILSEMPWVLDNQSNQEINKRLALLFDLEKMKVSLETTFTKLKNKQLPSGGFPWFEGGRESDYITQHVVTGFGQLHKMGIAYSDKKATNDMLLKAMKYIDDRFFESQRPKNGRALPFEMRRNSNIDYLYARSFYIDVFTTSDTLNGIIKNSLNEINKSDAYFKKQWLGLSLYAKAKTALVMHRFGYTDEAKKIISHLKETSSTNEEWGMYWIENKPGWEWHQAPVETQALLIEAFTEVANDTESADAMKVWLLKNKQNKNWPTTKSTTEAVYAMMIRGTDWLSVKDNTLFSFNNGQTPGKKIVENEKEAGTGYMKLKWTPDEIKTGMGSLTVENKSTVPGFGGFYWQRNYDVADKDYIPTQGPLSITKELYTKVTTDKDAQLQVKPLTIGDLVTIRLVITAKEDMEFLHLKDMRASAFEPVDVISGYKYKGDVSYYQSTRDVATNFFFDHIEKGVYVIEYDVRVNNAGDFSNGIATIQSMYAPEFSGNSKSTRIHIE